MKYITIPRSFFFFKFKSYKNKIIKKKKLVENFCALATKAFFGKKEEAKSRHILREKKSHMSPCLDTEFPIGDQN